MNRRAFLATAAALPAAAQTQQAISPYATPRDWSGQIPIRYPDPDIIALDPRFRRYIGGLNTTIRRHYTGTLWAEGPAWNGVGRYLICTLLGISLQTRSR